jgi:F-type H+-transporting ATPase subunit b
VLFLFFMGLIGVAVVPLARAFEQPATPEHVAQPDEHAAEEEHAEGEPHGTLAGLLWPTVNFVILCGGLYYFLREPLTSYLRERHATIRRDLVDAENLRTAASAQLAEIDRKLRALPAELEALRRRGAEEAAADERRISEQAAQERNRLLEQTRREIELRLRLAKRELTEHAATLAVDHAARRLELEITPADQRRLVDQYVDHMGTGGTR